MVYVDPSTIQELEQLFDQYHGIEARAFYYAIGYKSDTTNKDEDLINLSGWLQDIREKFSHLASKL